MSKIKETDTLNNQTAHFILSSDKYFTDESQIYHNQIIKTVLTLFNLL